MGEANRISQKGAKVTPIRARFSVGFVTKLSNASLTIISSLQEETILKTTGQTKLKKKAKKVSKGWK